MRLLSVIIPTLNEADYLSKTIKSLCQNSTSGIDKEILVVDSGSTDDTQEIVRQLDVQFIPLMFVPQGRAFALNEGAKHARGDVLLFLDADTIPPAGYDREIQLVLKDDRVIGGAFEFALEGPQFALRVVEVINRVRYRIWPRYFGDQGIFTRKGVFQKVGGYPPLGIMEASHFCIALRKLGKLALIKRKMMTSSRRFLDGGVYRILMMDM